MFWEVTMSHTRIFEWYKRCSEGRDEVKDDKHLDHHSTSKTDKNIEKVNTIFQNAR